MFLKLTVPFLALICLANCQSTSGLQSGSDITDSDFSELATYPDTVIDTSQSYIKRSDAKFTSDGLISYSYALGLGNFASTVKGYSSLNSITNISSPTKVSGTAKYRGNYKAGLIKEIKPDGGKIGVTLAEFTGPMTLEANFANKTLKGTSNDKKLVVDGTFSGRDLSGKVQFRKTNGQLKGQISDNTAIGVFHGHNDQNVYAGGFILEK